MRSASTMSSTTRRRGHVPPSRRPKETSMSTLGTRRAMARRTTAMIGAVGAAALVLSGCGSPDEQGTSVASSDGAIEETSLPAYVPIDAVEPDFPGVDGSPSGYLELP